MSAGVFTATMALVYGATKPVKLCPTPRTFTLGIYQTPPGMAGPVVFQPLPQFPLRSNDDAHVVLKEPSVARSYASMLVGALNMASKVCHGLMPVSCMWA